MLALIFRSEKRWAFYGLYTLIKKYTTIENNQEAKDADTATKLNENHFNYRLNLVMDSSKIRTSLDALSK
ncbi:MAG: hypothetical protein ICV53_21125 [Flavisolibacter sp.]|nr:hypothetical protein [Flavisolibacter sp.]